jgi:hypothetical protein
MPDLAITLGYAPTAINAFSSRNVESAGLANVATPVEDGEKTTTYPNKKVPHHP